MDIFAYLDPGTGSLFIQAIIGSALAIAVAFRGFIRGAFSKLKKSNSGQSKNSVNDKSDS